MASENEIAFIEVRALPWRPRLRVMDADRFRDNVNPLDHTDLADSLTGFLVVLGVWLVILIGAPVIVIVLGSCSCPSSWPWWDLSPCSWSPHGYSE